MDLENIQLSSLVTQYVKVEKERHKLAEQLQTSRKERRQLEAEVRFLHEKLRSFKMNPHHRDPWAAAAAAAAHDSRQVLNSVKVPQFFEVEVKFADSLQSSMVESAVYDHPSRF